MTNFEKITESPEALANELNIATQYDYGDKYCKSEKACEDDMDNINPDDCKQCLIDWLNQESEG